jgi:uncharacterized protein YfiM (DUF2279 family)
VSQQSCDDLETLRHGFTDKLLERLRRGDRDSQLIEHRREHAAGNQFAVDQNIVAIKDHQGKLPRRHVAAAEKERYIAAQKPMRHKRVLAIDVGGSHKNAYSAAASCGNLILGRI